MKKYLEFVSVFLMMIALMIGWQFDLSHHGNVQNLGIAFCLVISTLKRDDKLGLLVLPAILFLMGISMIDWEKAQNMPTYYFLGLCVIAVAFEFYLFCQRTKNLNQLV